MSKHSGSHSGSDGRRKTPSGVYTTIFHGGEFKFEIQFGENFALCCFCLITFKKYVLGVDQLCPPRGPRAACDPVEGFVRPGLPAARELHATFCPVSWGSYVNTVYRWQSFVPFVHLETRGATYRRDATYKCIMWKRASWLCWCVIFAISLYLSKVTCVSEEEIGVMSMYNVHDVALCGNTARNVAVCLSLVGHPLTRLCSKSRWWSECCVLFFCYMKETARQIVMAQPLKQGRIQLVRLGGTISVRFGS